MVARASIEDSVARYFASFATSDVDARLDLFADAVRFEDPRANWSRRASRNCARSGSTRCRATGTCGSPSSGVAIVGDEALATATISVRAGTRAPAEVVVNCHFVFRGGDGRIVQYRAFFDAASITERLAEG